MKGILTVLVVVAAILLTPAGAQAYGAARAGYTYRGPSGGVYHTSTAAVYGPNGEHTATRTTGYNPATGFYHTGTGQTAGAYGGTAYHSTATYGGYDHVGGYGAGGVATPYGSAAYAGAYRRW